MCLSTALLEVSVFVFSFAPFLDLIEMPPRKLSLQAHTVVTNLQSCLGYLLVFRVLVQYHTPVPP